MPANHCILCGQSKAVNGNIQLFQVPHEENRRKEWIEAVGKYLPHNSTICSNHFSRRFLGRKKLLKGAIPLCFKPASNLPESFIQQEIKIEPTEEDTENSSEKIEEPIVDECVYCRKKNADFVKCAKCGEIFHPICLRLSANQKQTTCKHVVQYRTQEDRSEKYRMEILNMENTYLKKLLQLSEDKNQALIMNNKLLIEKIRLLESEKNEYDKNHQQGTQIQRKIDSNEDYNESLLANTSNVVSSNVRQSMEDEDILTYIERNERNHGRVVVYVRDDFVDE